MNRTVVGFAVLLATVAAANADDDADKPGCARARAAAAQAAFESTAPGAPDAPEDTDVLHYKLEIEIDPATQWVGGSNRMTVRSLSAGLTEFDFRLKDNFNITAVEVGGAGCAHQRLDGATLRVTLDRPYNVGEEFELYVAYNGNPVSGGFGSIEFSTHGAGEPVVWSLSETWFAYTWWPTKDINTDKATAELWFTVPETMSVASNGVLAGVDPLAGGKKRFRWETNYPTATYLYCFAATNYDTFTGTFNYPGGSMPMEFYIYPEDNNSSNRNKWLRNAEMMDVFSDKYGLYPFIDEKYGMCQVGFGGGMEHQTMTSQGGFWEWITAHEQAHQWWGDMVTCATWHDIWLNEGFATYSEAIWQENKPGSSGTPALHAHMANRRPNSVNGSVYCYDISNMGRIFSTSFTYRKGGWVLHMLRHVVGDQRFFEILANYRVAFEYGSATTAEFQAIAEGVYGGDLTWFFGPWVYEIGAPAYRHAWRQEVVDGTNYVELYVQQGQDPSYASFTMPIDIVTTRAGQDTIHVIWNDEDAEHLLFATAEPIDALAFDPDNWILHTSTGTTAFVEGPAKVVVMTPAPGDELWPQQAPELRVVFHKDVIADASHVSLVGDQVGPVAGVFNYDAPTRTATFTPNDPLAVDAYTLTVSDGIVDVAAGLALDGELADPTDPNALPSGDGLPAGSAVARFTVTQPGDLDGDGDVDLSDLGILLADFGCTAPGPCVGDVDGDGDTDLEDLGVLLAHFGEGR